MLGQSPAAGPEAYCANSEILSGHKNGNSHSISGRSQKDSNLGPSVWESVGSTAMAELSLPLGTTVLYRTIHDGEARLKAAIRLLRNDSHCLANRAVLLPFPAQSACWDPAPLALWPRRGFGGGGDRPRLPEGMIPMSKPAKKRAVRTSSSRAKSARPVASKSPSQSKTRANVSKEGGERSTKQSRVIAMLQSSAGTTIAAVMKVTGWQQHSVRGFFAGAARKRLKLNIDSQRINGERIYRIVGVTKGKSVLAATKQR